MIRHANIIRFSNSANLVLHYAMWLASQNKADEVGQEYFLKAFTMNPDCIAGTVLANIGYRASEDELGNMPAATDLRDTQGMDLSGEAKKILELAVGEVNKQDESLVTTGHLLLAFVSMNREELESQGINVEELRSQLIDQIISQREE